MAKQIKNEEQEIDEAFRDLQPNKNKIRNILIVIGIILVFGFVFIVSEKQEEKIKKQNENKFFHEITVNNFNELLNSDKRFVLLLGRPGCSHCVAFKPIITNVAKDYEVDVYYLDTDIIETLDDWDSIWNLVEQEGTPTVAVIEKQKLIKSNAGEMTYEELVSFLEEAGVL